MTNEDAGLQSIVFIPLDTDITKKVDENWEKIHNYLGNIYDSEELINSAKSYISSDLIDIRENNNFEYYDAEDLVEICKILGYYLIDISDEVFITNIAYGPCLENLKRLIGDQIRKEERERACKIIEL